MRLRFMAALMVVSLLVLLVQDVPLFAYLRQVEHDKIVSELQTDAFVLAGRSVPSLETRSAPDDATISAIARKYQSAGGARVVIVDSNGIALFTSDADDSKVGRSYASRPEIATALGGRLASGSRYSTTLAESLLYVSVPIQSGERVLGAVRLTYPEQVVTSAVDGRLALLSIVALTTVLLAGIIGAIFSTSVTRRLKLLRDATEELADGTGNVRADEQAGAPEIRSLSRSFNQMADRMHGLLEQQRAFAADASHQLRTPLTAMRLKLERARDLIRTDPDGALDRLSAAEAEADRLGGILEGLLLLSRTEASTQSLETVDLGAIASSRVEQWQPLAQESGVELRYEGLPSLAIRALPLAPEQILDNYIDNALSVSSAGSTLIVRVEAADDASLHVLDEGPGLSEDERARAFDRFWRASREIGSSRDTGASHDTEGSGLGLAIVAQLARASGGSARLSPRPDGGLDAEARFERAR